MLTLCKDPYINTCILSHHRYKIIFHSDKDFCLVGKVFALMVDIDSCCSWYGLEQKTLDRVKVEVQWIINRTLNFKDYQLRVLQSMVSLGSEFEDLASHQKASSRCEFHEELQVEIPELSQSGIVPHTLRDLDDNVRRWKWIKPHQNALNHLKSTQLTRLADLVAKCPKMVRLYTDPGEDARPNYIHIANNLRLQVELVQINRFDEGHWRGYKWCPSQCASLLFRCNCLPVVPVKIPAILLRDMQQIHHTGQR